MKLADDDQIEVLEQLLKQYEPEFQKAQETAQRLAPIITNLRMLIASLGGGTVPRYEIANGESRRDPTTGVGMPPRRDFYATIPTIEAARQVLMKAGGGPMHVDDMIGQMFEVNKDDSAQFLRVKRTLVSELIRGMKRGIFEREPKKKNTFKLKHERNEAA
jgi:hypothetical protein